MKTVGKWYLLVLVVLCCTACNANKATRLSNFQQLNGNYTSLSQTYRVQSNPTTRINNYVSLLKLFNIYEQTNAVDVKFISDNQVQLSYWSATDSGTFFTERVFSGKPKKKYLQIFLRKERFNIPPIYGYNDIDRIRIGKTPTGDLLVMNHFETIGYIFIFAGGGSGNDAYTFKTLDSSSEALPKYDTIANKWGLYKDTQVLISPMYDFIQPYDTATFEVTQQKLKGVVDAQNQTIIPIQYVQINPIFENGKGFVYEVKKDDYYGLLDSLGQTILPVIYTRINYYPGSGARLKINDKYGELTSDGNLIPAVYDEYFYFFKQKVGDQRLELANVRQGEELFFIDKYGYRYDSKKISGALNPIYVPNADTKRKIEY